MHGVGESNRIQTAQRNSLVRNAIGPVLILLAIWLSFGPNLARVPETTAVKVQESDLTADPWRSISREEPTIMSGGYALGCMECHRLFPSRLDAQRTIAQHREIVLDHGLNDRCLNCHDDQQRDRLHLQNGQTVPFIGVARKCADCHGPTYRDWQRGMHGRTNGYWDVTRGEQRRLICTECHDPHAPAFKPMTVLPGPHTLRVTPQSETSASHNTNERDPLRPRTALHHAEDKDTTLEHQVEEQHQ